MAEEVVARRREVSVKPSEVGLDFPMFGLQLGEGWIRLSSVTWRATVTLRKKIHSQVALCTSTGQPIQLKPQLGSKHRRFKVQPSWTTLTLVMEQTGGRRS